VAGMGACRAPHMDSREDVCMCTYFFFQNMYMRIYIYDLLGLWQESVLVVHRTRIFGRCFGAKGLCSWTQVRESRHVKSCHTYERVMLYLAIFRTCYVRVYEYI